MFCTLNKSFSPNLGASHKNNIPPSGIALSTILNANMIYVVKEGKIITNGTHKELLSNSEIYKNFYEKQLKKS